MEIIVFLIIVAVIAFVFLRLFFGRALRTLINKFREVNALSEDQAATMAALDLKKKSVYDTLRSPRRDYKHYALQFLVQLEIVKTTDDHKLYLSEKKLAQSNISKTFKIEIVEQGEV